jgi:hypothetical protein
MHVVQRPRHADVPAGSARTRMTKYGFAVDILADPKTNPPIYHCIIQKQGSKEIVYWSQERTLRDAELNAEAFLAANRPDHARRR